MKEIDGVFKDCGEQTDYGSDSSRKGRNITGGRVAKSPPTKKPAGRESWPLPSGWKSKEPGSAGLLKKALPSGFSWELSLVTVRYTNRSLGPCLECISAFTSFGTTHNRASWKVNALISLTLMCRLLAISFRPSL